jgi:hypothetical protein
VNREEADLVWYIVLYVGAITSAIVFLRTLFVPPATPAGSTERKSPFELWMAFSQQRAQEELQADLEKYKIDKGLVHRTGPSSS